MDADFQVYQRKISGLNKLLKIQGEFQEVYGLLLDKYEDYGHEYGLERLRQKIKRNLVNWGNANGYDFEDPYAFKEELENKINNGFSLLNNHKIKEKREERKRDIKPVRETKSPSQDWKIHFPEKVNPEVVDREFEDYASRRENIRWLKNKKKEKKGFFRGLRRWAGISLLSGSLLFSAYSGFICNKYKKMADRDRFQTEAIIQAQPYQKLRQYLPPDVMNEKAVNIPAPAEEKKERIASERRVSEPAIFESPAVKVSAKTDSLENKVAIEGGTLAKETNLTSAKPVINHGIRMVGISDKEIIPIPERGERKWLQRMEYRGDGITLNTPAVDLFLSGNNFGAKEVGEMNYRKKEEWTSTLTSAGSSITGDARVKIRKGHAGITAFGRKLGTLNNSYGGKIEFGDLNGRGEGKIGISFTAKRENISSSISQPINSFMNIHIQKEEGRKSFNTGIFGEYGGSFLGISNTTRKNNIGLTTILESEQENSMADVQNISFEDNTLEAFFGGRIGKHLDFEVAGISNITENKEEAKKWENYFGKLRLFQMNTLIGYDERKKEWDYRAALEIPLMKKTFFSPIYEKKGGFKMALATRDWWEVYKGAVENSFRDNLRAVPTLEDLDFLWKQREIYPYVFVNGVGGKIELGEKKRMKVDLGIGVENFGFGYNSGGNLFALLRVNGLYVGWKGNIPRLRIEKELKNPYSATYSMDLPNTQHMLFGGIKLK